MKCYECNIKNGVEMINTFISMDLNIDGIKVTITGIPAEECPICYESVINADIADKLDKIAAEIRNNPLLKNSKRGIIKNIVYELAA